MTSRRQAAQDRYDHILPFIEEAADEYYGSNLDRGFRHWAFATVFGVGHDVQGNDIVEYTAIDGSDDFEVDGYFVPESDDDSVVHLFQSKHREPGTTMGPRELATFLNAPNRLLNANEVAASRNEETKALHDELIKRLTATDRPCSINMVWTTSGTLSPTACRHAEENRSRKLTSDIKGNPTQITVTLECMDLADLYWQHSIQQDSDDSAAPCGFTFQIAPGEYHQTNAEYPTLDKVQDRLQREFSAMTPPWFYEIKRGEWARMLGGTSAKEVYRNPTGGYRKLTTKEVAQAVVSFSGFPGEAKDNIRSFLNKDAVPAYGRESSVSYEAVYTDNLTASQLLLPAMVQRKVWQRVTDEKKNDESLDWLDYARFHIVWLVGDILRAHYQLPTGRPFPATTAAIAVAQIDDWFAPVYAVAVATISHTVEESRQKNDFAGYREFFRTPSKYRDIESNVRSAIRLAASVGNSPTSFLPS